MLKLRRRASGRVIGAIMMAAIVLAMVPTGGAAGAPGAAPVDTALIMSVDVSGSVD